MEENCPICGLRSEFIDQINGYVEGGVYRIFHCSICGLQFAKGGKSNLGLIYNSIYKNSAQIGGYDRYVRYFNEIKSKQGKDAIKYLINEEDTYKYVYRYLHNKDNCRDLKILEVGSGLGYFTYALSQDGFNILGVDLSEDAVAKSTNAFGKLYKVVDFNNLDEQFDIIILTEVIEHVSEPVEFLKGLKRILVKGGEILGTTPRKHIEQSRAIWLTELPPVHLFWYTTTSLQRLGNLVGLEFFEIDIRHKSLIFNTRNNNKPILDSDLLPLVILKKTIGFKHQVMGYMPLILKKVYYAKFKKLNVIISRFHNSIFFIYKL